MLSLAATFKYSLPKATTYSFGTASSEERAFYNAVARYNGQKLVHNLRVCIFMQVFYTGSRR
jgi:hypothetical protein